MAEEKLGELVRQRNALRYGHAPQNITWATFKSRYLEQSKQEKSKHTWQGEERAFRNLEDVALIHRLSQLTPAVLDKVKSTWIAKKRGIYVINRDLRSIRTAIHKAEAWGYTSKQDWSSVRYIKTPKGRLLFFSLEEIQKLRKVCRGPFLTILMLGARAGLRRAEIFWLEWSDVDFERNRIHIAPKDGWNPKDFERRWISMSPDLLAYLRQLHAKRADSWVLGDKEGKPTLASMSVYFRRMVRKAGLKKGSIHTLRHSFASHLAMAGTPLYTIGKLLGHSKEETTAIYAHLSPETMENAITRLPALP